MGNTSIGKILNKIFVALLIVATILCFTMGLKIGGGCFFIAFAIGGLADSIEKEKVVSGIVGAFVLLLISIPFLRIGINEKATEIGISRYTKKLGGVEKVLGANEFTGTKYVVYDKETGSFQPNYIKPEYRAETFEEIGGIFVLTTSSEIVGRYSDNSAASQYKCILELKDSYKGKVLGKTEIWGGQPPYSVKSTESHYGSYPSESEICVACEELLNEKN